MIQANELRLGNLIDFEGLPSVVKEIDSQGVVVFIGETGETEWIDLFQFNPIPLTEEILLKCGFEKIENNWKVLSYSNVFYFSWERLAGSAFSLDNESIYLPHIEYLHQLQNLYFALTGEELEINL